MSTPNTAPSVTGSEVAPPLDTAEANLPPEARVHTFVTMGGQVLRNLYNGLVLTNAQLYHSEPLPVYSDATQQAA